MLVISWTMTLSRGSCTKTPILMRHYSLQILDNSLTLQFVHPPHRILQKYVAIHFTWLTANYGQNSLSQMLKCFSFVPRSPTRALPLEPNEGFSSQRTPTFHTPQPFYHPGPPGWAGARRELLDFMVQGKTTLWCKGKLTEADTPTTGRAPLHPD